MFDFLPTDRERVAFRHALHVDCQVVRERDFRLVGRRTLDVSTTGMLVVAELDVAPGDDLVVSFRAPRTDRFVDAEAKVARVVHGRRRGDVARAVGLEFSAMDRAAFTTLRTALRRLPGVRPRRPQRVDHALLVRAISIV